MKKNSIILISLLSLIIVVGTISAFNPSKYLTEKEVLNQAFAKLSVRTDLNSDDLPQYIGEAYPGTLVNESNWRIKQVNYTNGVVVQISYPNGDNKFNYVWDNRTTYTYS